MPFFKNVFKSKDGPRSGSKAGHSTEPVAPPKPRWEDAWSRKDVAPEEIQELIYVCTQEMKSRGASCPSHIATAAIANPPQHWTCPSCYYPSAPPPIPAPHAISYGTSSRRPMMVHACTRARAWPKNCALQSHWYDHVPLSPSAPHPRSVRTLTPTDIMQYHEMVLESIARWCRDMGCIRALPHW